MKIPCRHPGCRMLLDKSGYCDTHAHHAKQHQRNADKRRYADPTTALAARFRTSREWQRARHRQIVDFPLCEDPHGKHGDRTTTATQVHHIKPLATHYHLRIEPDNLMSVCPRCHDVFNRLERKEES